MSTKSHEMDMTHGGLALKILVFALPLMLSGILQALFNAADVVVVGRFSGSESLAAVGSASSLGNLLLNLFIGFSVSTNILVARAYGAKNQREIDLTVHTSMLVGVIGGILVGTLGIFLSRNVLLLMGTPDDVIDLSVIYFNVCMIGEPAILIYNFGSAIMRAIGDTRRPLYIITLSGALNVILNLIFVIVFKLGVLGVALATVISQYLSAVLIVICLIKSKTAIKLDLKKLGIDKKVLVKIIKIGLPSGLQGIVFSLSNIVLQSAVNSFGSATMAGSAAAANIEGFIYVAMNAFYQAAMTFTGQNAGANKYNRVKKSFFISMLYVTIAGLLLGNGAYLLINPLLGLYTDSAAALAEGAKRALCVMPLYFLCGAQEVVVGCIRGLGYSVVPMIVSLIGACGLRLVWVFTVFKMHRSLIVLFLSYPITWTIILIAHCIYLYFVYNKSAHQSNENIRPAS